MYKNHDFNELTNLTCTKNYVLWIHSFASQAWMVEYRLKHISSIKSTVSLDIVPNSIWMLPSGSKYILLVVWIVIELSLDGMNMIFFAIVTHTILYIFLIAACKSMM